MAKFAASSNGWIDLLSEGRAPQIGLICLGSWLNAADALVTSTIMPSVGAQLGGYGYFSWSMAGFLVGSILAGASAGRIAERFGLGPSSAMAGLVMAGGCVMSALAPDPAVFLTGRLVQGLGGGWIGGFGMVATVLLFPERHLARVLAAVTFVWGVATLLGPLFGGLVVEGGGWRDVFWLFALQALVFSAAAPLLFSGLKTKESGPGVPWVQLAVLGLGVGAIGLADGAKTAALAVSLVIVGIVILALVFHIDGRARVRLAPRRAGDLATVVGSGYFATFAMAAASMGLATYGPAILQQLRGFSPLWAGYVVSVESVGWTIAGLATAHITGAWDGRLIRIGAICLVVSLGALAWSLADKPLMWVLAGAALLGTAFGFSWAFINRRIIAALSQEDRAIGSSAVNTVRQAGAAAGAAICGVAANLAGFSEGLTAASARSTSVWVFVSVIPLALLGAWASFRLTGSAERA